MGAVSKLLLDKNNQPTIDQMPVNGWPISWNPDDGRFYVERADMTAAGTFKDLRNARQYAKTHNVN